MVREDPELEEALAERVHATAALLVCSGGCTALHLKQRLPDLALTVFDIQAAQLEHLRAKEAAARAGDLAALNVDTIDPSALNQRGAFEGLFRTWLRFIEEFVAAPQEIERFFSDRSTPATRSAQLEQWRSSRYWPASFDVAFADPFLHAMFGPDATQHAEPGSYPRYFQRAFERGLASPDAANNPFLQHMLLQRYLPSSAPAYTQGLSFTTPIEAICGTLLDVPDLGRFDLFSLSNVFDWSPDDTAAAWGAALAAAARPGSAVLIRQLNNRRDVRRFFSPAFRFDDDLGRAFAERDRSLFYERVEVGFRADRTT